MGRCFAEGPDRNGGTLRLWAAVPVMVAATVLRFGAGVGEGAAIGISEDGSPAAVVETSAPRQVSITPLGGDRSDGEPDIAFSRDVGSTIWVMDADGGNQQQLTTYRSGDAVWSPDGTKIAFTRFDGSTYDGVWMMDAEGGQERRLTTGLTGGPSWSPDGDHLAYTSPVGIEVVSVDNASSRHFTINADRDPAWSPEGSRLLFSRFERGVWVMRDDGTRERQLAREARHAAWSPDGGLIAYTNHHLEGIHVMDRNGFGKSRLTSDGGIFPQWSPDGTRIAYTGRQRNEIWVVDPDGNNRKQLTGKGWDPAWAPDNARIAYARHDGIWVMDSDGTNHQHLSTSGSDPAWSPDGGLILYTSSHLDGVYVMDLDGTNRKQLTSEGFHPAWSPDGGSIVFSRRDGLWLMDSNGANRIRLADGYAESAVWAPDGTRIAYANHFGGVHTRDPDGGNHLQLAPNGSDPAWSPDATRIAFTTAGDEGSPGTSDPVGGIHVVEADGAHLQRLTADGSDPAWSPDGTRIAYSTNSGEIRVIGVGEADQRPTGRYGSSPAWSPDGTRIAYVGNGGGIFVMYPDGSDHRTVTLDAGLRPAWSSDGMHLAYHTSRGVTVVDLDGSHRQDLAAHGEAPAWRPSEKSTPSTPRLSCPTETRPNSPRFLPLSVTTHLPGPRVVTGPFEVVISFSRPVADFSVEEVSVINGRVTHFLKCRSSYVARISPSAAGAVGVRIPPNVARDLTSHGNAGSPWLVVTGVTHNRDRFSGIDTWDRVAVARSLAREFEREQPAPGYTGRIEDCLAGSTSQAFRDSVLQRVNWYRNMAGLGTVKERSEYSRSAQQTAMMMAAENALSHTPDRNWSCHTSAGETAADNSNLLLGAVGIHAVDGYMRNHGPANPHVGHRRLILNPLLSEMGTGDVPASAVSPAANALYISGYDAHGPGVNVREQRGFVAWPPAGYVPAGAVWDRWSFSLPGADFSRARVRVTNDSGPVPVEVLVRDFSFSGSQDVPPAAVVWTVDRYTGPGRPGGVDHGDTCHIVVIEGVRIEGRIQAPYEYATCVLGS